MVLDLQNHPEALLGDLPSCLDIAVLIPAKLTHEGDQNDALEERDGALAGPDLSVLSTLDALLLEQHHLLLELVLIKCPGLVWLYRGDTPCLLHLLHYLGYLLISKAALLLVDSDLLILLLLLAL